MNNESTSFSGLGRKKLRNAMASDLPQSIHLIQVNIESVC